MSLVRVMGAAVAFAAGMLVGLAGCATSGGTSPAPPTSAAMPGEPFEYPTHCGVGQTSVDGTVYYPTGVYDGDQLVTGNDPSWYTSAGGPTPWITVVDNTVTWKDGVADMNTTFGTLERLADSEAVFHVNGGRWSIHLSTDQADAAWTIEGCS